MLGRCSSMRSYAWAARENARSSLPATWGSCPARAASERNLCINGTRLPMTSTLRDSHHRFNGHSPTPRSHERGKEGVALFRWETEVFVLRGDDRAELRR